MSHSNTILNQVLKLFSRHEFEHLATAHHEGAKLRSATRWSQFVYLLTGQLTKRDSLRDIVDNMDAQSHRLYHLGSKRLPRSTLSRMNNTQSYKLYEDLFFKLLSRCEGNQTKHKFRFKNKLFSLDASTIDLCLAVFPWAEFRQTKGAIKLHVGLDHDGLLPKFVTVTDGKTADITEGRDVDFPKGSIVVCDRGYTDYQWYNDLTGKGVFFVSRQKKNARYRVIKKHDFPQNKGILSDEEIELSAEKYKGYKKLRRIRYLDKTDKDNPKEYTFVTNHFKLSARTIADIYKSRWEVELFFKWVKQNLKIKSFLGTSKNAVMTQVWVAMCTYLIVNFIKTQSKSTKTMRQILRLLSLNLFEKTELIELATGIPIKPPDKNNQQLILKEF